MSDHTTQIEKLYVAYFARAVDPAGLAYWNEKIDSGQETSATLSATLGAAAEYQSPLTGLLNSQVVDALYMNMFGRHAESGGLAYWGGMLDQHLATVSEIAAAISYGAQSTDLDALNAKAGAAGVLSQAIGADVTSLLAYTGQHAYALSKDYLAPVHDAASFAAATTREAVAAFINAIESAAAPVAVGDSHPMVELIGTAGIPAQGHAGMLM